jgi:hypothetical protein
MDGSYCVALHGMGALCYCVVRSCPILGPLSQLCSPRSSLSCGIWANSSPVQLPREGIIYYDSFSIVVHVYITDPGLYQTCWRLEWAFRVVGGWIQMFYTPQ